MSSRREEGRVEAGKRSKFRGQRSEVRDQRSEVRGQQSVRSAVSEVTKASSQSVADGAADFFNNAAVDGSGGRIGRSGSFGESVSGWLGAGELPAENMILAGGETCGGDQGDRRCEGHEGAVQGLGVGGRRSGSLADGSRVGLRRNT